METYRKHCSSGDVAGAVDHGEIAALITNRTPRTAALLLMMKKDLLPKMLTFQENRCFSSKFSQRSPKEQL